MILKCVRNKINGNVNLPLTINKLYIPKREFSYDVSYYLIEDDNKVTLLYIKQLFMDYTKEYRSENLKEILNES